MFSMDIIITAGAVKMERIANKSGLVLIANKK